MIRSYSIGEMESLSGTNRRTISDYITKGLLTGPSHRGRGAVYSQRDLNVLHLLPRLRTLMKEEFGSLKAVATFLSQLSTPDIHALASRRSERAFVVEVRRLRVRRSMMELMPNLAPEHVDAVFEKITPEQICAIDAGRLQLGAVVDMRELLDQADEYDGESFDAFGSGAASANVAAEPGEVNLDDTDTLPGPALVAAAAAAAGQTADEDTKTLLATKLREIADRLDRVEQMLEAETE